MIFSQGKDGGSVTESIRKLLMNLPILGSFLIPTVAGQS